MFIDSDFNGNSFGNFDTDATQDASLYASGSRPGARRANLQGTDWQTSNMSNAAGPISSGYLAAATKYGIDPSIKEHKDAGSTECGGFSGIFRCMGHKLLGQYAEDSSVKSAYDAIAKTKNSYGYTLASMVSALSSVTSKVSNEVPINSDMNCSQYVEAKTGLNSLYSSWNSAAVDKQFDRDLREKYLNNINQAISEVDSFMDARDCNGSTSAIDTAQDEVIAANDQVEAANEAANDQAVASENLVVELQAQKDAEVQALKDDLEQSKDDAQVEQDALAKRNKMIMFGAGIVILILILKKK